MLIDQGLLDKDKFAELLPMIKWTKLPRKLGPDHKEFFYSGQYENAEKTVLVTIRPSLWMAISESFKNRKLDGSIPEEGYKGQLVSWGASTEVRVDSNFVEKVDSLAQSMEKRVIQTVNW